MMEKLKKREPYDALLISTGLVGSVKMSQLMDAGVGRLHLLQ